MTSLSQFSVTTLISLAVLFGLPALAEGTEDGSSQTATVATYADAKSLIDSQNYTEARAMLQDITRAEPRNADAWNLLGFSSRKLGDLKAASKAYSKALKLNPDHLGALEYQGEMFVQMGDAASAKANLATLQTICGTCEEMRDLQKALADAGIS